MTAGQARRPGQLPGRQGGELDLDELGGVELEELGGVEAHGGVIPGDLEADEAVQAAPGACARTCPRGTAVSWVSSG